MSNKTQLQTNNTKLTELTSLASTMRAKVAALPDAGGVDLPELSNPGSASDLMLSKELIDSDGNVVTGTFTIDEELTDQEDLITQIQTALAGKTSASPALQQKTVSPSTNSQTVTPDSGYDGLSQVTVNAMTTATQATPSISVSSAGVITASSTQTAGYVAAGTKSATKNLTTQAAKTVTPSTSSQTAVASGVYTTGAVTVAGDSNLVAGNIKSGVSIFGVAGSYGGSGSGGAVETCTVDLASPYDWELETLLYSDGNEIVNFLIENVSDRISLTVAKNTLLYIKYGSMLSGVTIVGDAEKITGGDISSFYCLVSINGDCSIDPGIEGPM